VVVGDLTWAEAEYPSMYGEIRSAWRRTDDGLVLRVTIPANTTARVYVPVPRGIGKFSVTESGTPVLTEASGVAGVRFIETRDNAAVFDVAAGSYTFVVERK